MKALSVFRRALRQQARDRLGLVLTLLTTPFFVVFYWAVFAQEPDVRACVDAAPETVDKLAESLGDDSSIVLSSCAPSEAYDVEVVAAGLERPGPDPVAITFRGDASAPHFGATVGELQIVVDAYVAARRGETPRLATTVEALGGSADRSPFDLYVPSLLIFAVIMLIFSSAMALAREIESGTLERLRLTEMSTSDYLLGMALVQTVLGASSIGLTFALAVGLGFEATGSIPLAAGIALLTGVACVGVGTLAASFSRTVAQAFVVASFFMFLLMLFSGVVFPLPDVAVFDLLPTVHGARAMHDVLVLGEGLGGIREHLVALAGLSLAIYLIGGLRFRRLHKTFLQRGDQ